MLEKICKKGSTKLKVEDNIENGSSINDINIELLENLDKLLNIITNNSLSAIKIKRINDYINTSYPELQADFESRFPKTYALNGFKNHINIFSTIIENILHKDIKTTFFSELSEKDADLGNQFIEIIFKYLSNKLNLQETKNKIFLISHEINSLYFDNLSQSGLFALCEMSERGVDISRYNNAGNLKLIFLNDAANGKFKGKQQEALDKQNLIDTIERCLKEQNIEEIEYNDDFSLIFEPSNYGVSIFDNSDLENSIAEINVNEEFEKGSLNIILITIYKNTEIPNEDNSKTKNTIDNIISRYNELAEEQQSNQPDLATALRLALGLGNQSESNSNNSSN